MLSIYFLKPALLCLQPEFPGVPNICALTSHSVKSRPNKVNTAKGNNLSGDSLPKVLYILWHGLIYLSFEISPEKEFHWRKVCWPWWPFCGMSKTTTWPGNMACKRAWTIIRRWAGAPSWIHQALRTPPSALRPNIRCRASNTGLFHYMGQHNHKNATSNFTVEYQIHPAVLFMSEF